MRFYFRLKTVLYQVTIILVKIQKEKIENQHQKVINS